MTTFRKHIAITAIIFIACSHAHAQVDDTLREMTTDLSNFLKDAIKMLPKTEFKRTQDPFKIIAGNWYDNNATITSVSMDPNYERYNYSWKGQIIGRVNEIGEYIFRAENGCEITGTSVPFASDSMWSITTKTTKCPFSHLNHFMAGRIAKSGNILILYLEDPPMAMGRKLAFKMHAVMLQY